MSKMEIGIELQKLLKNLSVGERTKLSRKIGTELRKSQRKRISEQTNPDGSKYVPRRKRLRDQKGKIRRKMFVRIKNNNNLNLMANHDSVTLSFVNRVNRIANVHQFGLKDRAEKDAPVVLYPKRELLGFTEQDIKVIEEVVFKHIQL